MSYVNTFKTPSGDEMVILTLAEYNALLDAAAEAEEDAADAAIYAERKAELEKNPEAIFPPEVSALINNGNSRLKAVRKWRKANQIEVAAHLGVSQGYLSDLETGRRNVTDDIAAKLAGFYDVPTSWLDGAPNAD